MCQSKFRLCNVAQGEIITITYVIGAIKIVFLYVGSLSPALSFCTVIVCSQDIRNSLQ